MAIAGRARHSTLWQMSEEVPKPLPDTDIMKKLLVLLCRRVNEEVVLSGITYDVMVSDLRVAHEVLEDFPEEQLNWATRTIALQISTWLNTR